MIITVTRFADTRYGTFGTLTLPDGWSCYTVEQPWKDNAPSVSCIPHGAYRLALDRYHKGGYPAYHLLDVPNRARIIIHKANRADELEGCIAPGSALGCIAGDWAVSNSGRAFDHIMAVLEGSRAPEIHIRWLDH